MKRSILLVSLLAVSSIARADLQPINEVFAPTGNFDPAHYAKVAVVQWAPSESTPLGVTVEQAEAFKEQNRQVLENYIREAASHGAELVLTPEFAVVGYPDIPELPSEEDDFRNRDDIRPYVEPIPGPTSRRFEALAKELHIYIHVGFAEVDPATDKYYNTVIAIDPNGQIVAKYHKVNLFELETKFLSTGDAPATYDSPFGKIGIIICADVYSAFPMSAYTSSSVQVLALSTSWAQWNTGMDTFARAASSSHMYLMAANQPYFPDSGVINPDGSLQSHIRQSQGVAYGYLPRVSAPGVGGPKHR